MEKENNDNYEFEDESPPSLLSESGGLWQTVSKKTLILGGAVSLLIVLMITAVFTRDEDRAGQGHMQQSPSFDVVDRLQNRFERLEERIDAVEMQLTRLPGLIHQVETMETGDSTGRFDQVVAGIDRLDNRIKELQEETRQLKSRQQALSDALSQQRTAAAAVPERKAETGGTRNHEVQKGDTLYSIARANNIPLQTLLDANRLTRNSVIQPGDRLVIPR